MKKMAVTLAAAAWFFAGPGVARAEEKTLIGQISDSLCGMSHKEMAEKQKSQVSDRDCVIACLNYSTENSPKLVFVVKGGPIYLIANQKFPGLIRRAGENVAVTGDVAGTTITVTKIDVIAAK
jgi:hypothetical protein